MKKNTLLRNFSSILFVLTFLFMGQYSDAGNHVKTSNPGKKGNDGIASMTYLSMLRNNQVTGQIDPNDIVKAKAQVEKLRTKSTSSQSLDWVPLGPDNVAGRTRAILFDKRDPSFNTIYAGNVTGGLWKSTNLGLTWHEVNTASNEVLRVTSIVQMSNGTIWVGTGESFCVQKFSGIKDFKYTDGFMGSGIYSSADGENFSVAPSTKPVLNITGSDFAFINELAVDSRNDRLFAATNTGLKYSDDGNTWIAALNGFSFDVKVGSDGTVITQVGDSCYVAYGGDVNNFINAATGAVNGLPNTDVGRAEFAFASSDPNIIYASISKKSDGNLLNVYISEDNGATWSVIFPGNEIYEPFSGQGCYANTIVVHPDNPHQVLLGGVDMWVGTKIQTTGFFDWEQLTFNSVPPETGFYVHSSHHRYVIKPDNHNLFVIGSDGGVSIANLTGATLPFQERNKNYMTSQFYSIGFSDAKNIVIGGTQGSGIQYIDGGQNSEMGAKELWDNGTSSDHGIGGYAAISMINPNVIVFTKSNPGAVSCSEDRGATYSVRFPGGVNDSISDTTGFIHRFGLWESFNFTNSPDSVKFIAKDSTIAAGTTLTISSSNHKFPFSFATPVTIPKGDSIKVPDAVQSRFFLYCRKNPGGTSGIYMTKDLLKFTVDPQFFQLAAIPDSSMVTCFAISSDLNYVYAGTKTGHLYRLSNVAMAHNFATADIKSPTCIVSKEIVKYFPHRTITSVNFAKDNDNRMILTLGNYGNNDYIYLTDNALDSLPAFTNAQGNLPQMPIYSGLIEINNNNNSVIVGTDFGVFSTDNISDAAPVWNTNYAGIGNVPVFMLVQQRMFQPYTAYGDFSYPGIRNYGVIYAATYGKGLFMDTTFYEPMGIGPVPGNASAGNKIKAYPNPFSDRINLELTVAKPGNISLDIYDLAGKNVQTNSFGRYSAGKYNITVDCSSIPAGSYLIHINIAGTSAYSKIMKIK